MQAEFYDQTEAYVAHHVIQHVGCGEGLMGPQTNFALELFPSTDAEMPPVELVPLHGLNLCAWVANVDC